MTDQDKHIEKLKKLLALHPATLTRPLWHCAAPVN